VPCSTHDVAAAIRHYCAEHPQARDTIEGIGWWVQMQLQEEFRTRLVEAIQLLTQEGTLERYRLQDGSEVFGCKSHPAAGDPGDQHE
jgi:hypothetical protein